jgi:ribosomal protein L16 Arg81 hydroxylase
MDYKYFPNQFKDYTCVSWVDIDRQIEYEVDKGKCLVTGGDNVTYTLLYQRKTQQIFKDLRKKMKKERGYHCLHIYASKAANATTFNRHKDENDVLIVQSVGSMMYTFDNGDNICLNPGDGLFIPKSVYHNPICIEPRITLSFS